MSTTCSLSQKYLLSNGSDELCHNCKEKTSLHPNPVILRSEITKYTHVTKDTIYELVDLAWCTCTFCHVKSKQMVQYNPMVKGYSFVCRCKNLKTGIHLYIHKPRDSKNSADFDEYGQIKFGCFCRD